MDSLRWKLWVDPTKKFSFSPSIEWGNLAVFFSIICRYWHVTRGRRRKEKRTRLYRVIQYSDIAKNQFDCFTLFTDYHILAKIEKIKIICKTASIYQRLPAFAGDYQHKPETISIYRRLPAYTRDYQHIPETTSICPIICVSIYSTGYSCICWR